MRTRRFTTLASASLLALMLGAVACGSDDGSNGDGAAAEPAGDRDSAERNEECAPELDEAFAAWAEAGFSGVIAVSTGPAGGGVGGVGPAPGDGPRSGRGDGDCFAAYGMADRSTETPNTVDTVFAVGSVSKAFAAAAIFHLVDDGKLALDDRAGDLVPDLGGPVADVTIEQLLLHTSGLVGSHGEDHRPLERDEAVAAISGLELAFEPGSDFEYSNAGYTLLALIVEQVSGTTYREYMASEVLPLPDGRVAGGFWDGEPAAPGPRAVGYHDEGEETTGEMGDFAGPHWALSGNGDLAMTVPDLAAWARALFTGRIVSDASTEAIVTTGFDYGDGTREAPGWVALGAEVLGEPAFAVAGGGGDIGHDAVVAWLPESERVIAMASNTPDVTAEDLLQAVGPALVAGDPLPRPQGPADDGDRGDAGDGGGEGDGAADIDPDDLAALAGTYELEAGGSFEVTVGDEGLKIAANGPEAMAALFPPSDGFTLDDVAAHEGLVQALLAGETQAGREEREILESELGPIDHVEAVGTIVRDGELRTYVTLASGSEIHVAWYSVDEEGGIAAVELDAESPTLLVVPVGDGEYRPDDPTGTGPDVTVSFDGDRMTVAGPAGSTEARVAA